MQSVIQLAAVMLATIEEGVGKLEILECKQNQKCKTKSCCSVRASVQHSDKTGAGVVWRLDQPASISIQPINLWIFPLKQSPSRSVLILPFHSVGFQPELGAGEQRERLGLCANVIATFFLSHFKCVAEQFRNQSAFTYSHLFTHRHLLADEIYSADLK